MTGIKKDNVLFFLIINSFALYSMQEDVKEAFNKLEKQQQKRVCDSIRQKGSFVIVNNAHSSAKWSGGNPSAVQMIKTQDDGRIVIFKGRDRFEVLISVFASMCSIERI